MPDLRGRQRAALLALAENPGGLRAGAYPSAMPVLVALGLARARRRGDPGWVATAAGRVLSRRLRRNEE